MHVSSDVQFATIFFGPTLFPVLIGVSFYFLSRIKAGMKMSRKFFVSLAGISFVFWIACTFWPPSNWSRLEFNLPVSLFGAIGIYFESHFIDRIRRSIQTTI